MARRIRHDMLLLLAALAPQRARLSNVFRVRQGRGLRRQELDQYALPRAPALAPRTPGGPPDAALLLPHAACSCYRCPKGHVLDRQVMECKPCVAGRVPDPTQLFCVRCPVVSSVRACPPRAALRMQGHPTSRAHARTVLHDRRRRVPPRQGLQPGLPHGLPGRLQVQGLRAAAHRRHRDANVRRVRQRMDPQRGPDRVRRVRPLHGAAGGRVRRVRPIELLSLLA